MPQDPRSRISVGIDGTSRARITPCRAPSRHPRLRIHLTRAPRNLLVSREGRQYARKDVFIDVLHLPTITEAVRAASDMLHRGLYQAMSTIPEDEALLRQARIERQKAQAQSAAAAAASAADRHPVSVYSDVITKRPRKDDLNDTGSPVLIVKETPASGVSAAAAASAGRPSAWNSAKKAGPSILTKRARPPGAAPDRVFQPAKREKRAEMEKKQALLNAAAQTRASTRVRDTANPHANVKGLAVAKRVVEERRLSAVEKGITKGPETTAQKLLRGLAKSSQTERQRAQGGKLPAKQVRSTAELRGGTIKKPALVPVQGRAGQLSKEAALRKVNRGVGAAGAAGKFTLEQLNMLRNRTEGLPSARARAQAATAAEGAMPRPSTTGVKVKYIPGSKVINGVRPNGYTVSVAGVVKPVATFCPKPKLPHKLRQVSLEKMFEALRDVKRLPEGEALADALRMEQEMYAESPGRVEYRAAVTTRLKELRST